MSITLTSATGKLGSAVLDAILDNKLVDPAQLVVCTSSDTQDKRFDALRDRKVTLRYNNFDEPDSLERAFAGCFKLFLVSTPKVDMDYKDAPLWRGREAHHRAAIDAAIKAGIKHIYYTSLAYANPPRRASCARTFGKIEYTFIREGLYNESWPLYFGYFFKLRDEERQEVIVAGDGPISWTAIKDMAFATAKIIAAPSDSWKRGTLYLSQSRTLTLEQVARLVSRLQCQDVSVKIVLREEYVDHYAQQGMERASVEWWSSTYDALKDGEGR
ncbi:NAD(P)-binding protein [Bimuria novae-zelandiae CBS 107.79]|uniref:NAD(P)-binding protein n=1 Tax=Bimuria novae-zelandiae CBS 107.79 TaxID=1447943 RepID=A0A6A5UNG2_9PLEO|nr:NAD(P)-binding protein [Bimuria novae-zelandiae CBS 107.79]